MYDGKCFFKNFSTDKMLKKKKNIQTRGGVLYTLEQNIYKGLFNMLVVDLKIKA